MSVEILEGDCIRSMQSMKSRGFKIQTCVTSPPYWGLRDYGHDEQIGMEPSPDDYVARLVDVFRAVRDIMADDGTLWVNLGDSYAAQRGGTAMPAETLAGGVNGHGDHDAHRGRRDASSLGARQDESSPTIRTKAVAHRNASAFGLKHKDLIGIPWRVAFALQADGWYLRSDIIWAKPNPMPESVTDRPTKSHEYIFLLSKSDRYYYDHEAIKEDAVTVARKYGKNSRANVDRVPREITKQDALEKRTYTEFNERYDFDNPNPKRNKRDVWTVPVKPYHGAHFATFPPDLIEPCILAGSRTGDIVLDPFGGSGTTAEVAMKHGRRAVLCELNGDYLNLIHQRLGLPLPDLILS